MSTRSGLLDRHIAFLEALRAAGLPVSISEDLDAVSVLQALDWADRATLKEGYAATLVKRHQWRPTFDALFDLYFPRMIGEGAGGRLDPAAEGVEGEAGEGGPVIAILGEYDALPELSQAPGVSEHQPLPNQPAGHGCGHNLLGAGAMLAAAAVKDYLVRHGLKGRVRYYGCLLYTSPSPRD